LIVIVEDKGGEPINIGNGSEVVSMNKPAKMIIAIT